MTANETLAAEAVRHSVYLARYESGAIRRIIALLNRTDPQIVAALVDALDRLGPDAFTVQRLDSLLSSVRALNAEAYQSVSVALESELREFAFYEAEYQSKALSKAVPAQMVAELGIASINAEQVYAAAMARPFQGRLLSEWAASIEAGRMEKIRDTIRMGLVANKTSDQMIRDIRGTAANRYADGVLEISRRHAAAVVQTAVAHTAGFTRDRFYAANTGLIRSIQWVSTLDSRTTPMCMIRDGKEYMAQGHRPIGHSVPWDSGPGRLHWNCRSTSVPVLKKASELGGRDIEWSASTRASMDGQVPDDMTYGQWLKGQSAEVQDDVLGKTRAELLRKGKISFDRFYNDRGQFLTLDELRERDSKAFGG